MSKRLLVLGSPGPNERQTLLQKGTMKKAGASCDRDHVPEGDMQCKRTG